MEVLTDTSRYGQQHEKTIRENFITAGNKANNKRAWLQPSFLKLLDTMFSISTHITSHVLFVPSDQTLLTIKIKFIIVIFLHLSIVIVIISLLLNTSYMQKQLEKEKGKHRCRRSTNRCYRKNY